MRFFPSEMMTVIGGKLAFVLIFIVLLSPLPSFAMGMGGSDGEDSKEWEVDSENLVKAVIAMALYGMEPYNNPICNCCLKPGDVMHEMIVGEKNWTQPDDLQNEYYVDDLFKTKIKIALQRMADEARNVIATNAMMVGAFLDGQSELNSLTRLQKLNAETMKAYQPSDQICRFGTISRSLALGNSQSTMVQVSLMDEIQNRQLMKRNMNSAFAKGDGITIGRSADKKGRLKQLKTEFCDGYDLDQAWNSSGANMDRCEATSMNVEQHNRDIDFTRTIGVPENLNIDFPTNITNLTNDEENVIALANNLYAHDIPNNIGQSDLSALAVNGTDSLRRKLLDFRSIIAKRSVAANSFAAITGMKARGGTTETTVPTGGGVSITGASATGTYLEAIARELGLTSAEDVREVVGTNPSYSTQMEFLTKRLYQSPNFYANLYDSPANVERQQTSLEAIGLMQDRDIYESLQRSEMLLSTLLEIYVQKEQNRYFNKGMK